jgi:hypothetical protein
MSSNPKQQQQQLDLSSSTIGGKSIYGNQELQNGQDVNFTIPSRKQTFLQMVKRKGKQTGTAVLNSLPSFSVPTFSTKQGEQTFLQKIKRKGKQTGSAVLNSLPSITMSGLSLSSFAETPRNITQKSVVLFSSYFLLSLVVYLLFRIPSFFNGIFKTSLTRSGIMVPFTILFSKKRETVLEKTGVNLSGMKWYTQTFLYVLCIWYVLSIFYFFSFGILAFLAGTVYILKGKTDEKLVRRFSDPFWKYVAHPYALIRHLLLLPLQFLNVVMMSTTATLSTPATFITALIVLVWIIVYFSSK